MSVSYYFHFPYSGSFPFIFGIVGLEISIAGGWGNRMEMGKETGIQT